jgi:hypothetical protein
MDQLQTPTGSSTGGASLISSDFGCLLQNLLEACLLCRPSDALSFSRRYLLDEKEKDTVKVSLLHACHALPFLLARPTAFRDTASTIFCYFICKQSIGSKVKSLGRRLCSVFRLMRSDYFSPSPQLEHFIFKMAGKDGNEDRIGDVETLLHSSPSSTNDKKSNRDLLNRNLLPSSFGSFLGFLQLTIACHALSMWLNNLLADMSTSDDTHDNRVWLRLTSHIKKQPFSPSNAWTQQMQDAWSLLAINVIEKLPTNTKKSTESINEAIIEEYFDMCSKEIN